jgi:threonine dehydrogenase-like Zn-dependent dehydrogenase
VRRTLAATLGLETVDPATTDVAAHVSLLTAGAGADVVFEVSGSAAGATAMTELAGLRGRVVVVAIFPAPTPVRLFDLFWKELDVRGARVYEPEDYRQAIDLVQWGNLPLDELITSVEPLERLPEVFVELGQKQSSAVKVLIDCRR